MSTAPLVLVTGAGGFIAGHLISVLLARGYRVRATTTHRECTTAAMNDAGNNLMEAAPDARGSNGNINGANSFEKNYLSHLTSLPQATTHLEIVYADLNDPDSWEQAVGNDVTIVVHAAAPYTDLKPSNPENDLYRPIVNGTEALLLACKNCPPLKKFVLVSCIGALADEFDNSRVYTDSDWNITSSLDRCPYAFCKVTQETNAFRFVNANECRFSMISVLPGIVLGPHLGKRENLSHRFLSLYLGGKVKAIPDLYANICDVRDVATGILTILESSRASGRYIFADKAISHAAMLQFVHDNFPDINLPHRKAPSLLARAATRFDSSGRSEYLQHNLGRCPRLNNSRATEIGVTLRPPGQTVVDTCRFLLDNNLVDVHGGKGGCTVM